MSVNHGRGEVMQELRYSGSISSLGHLAMNIFGPLEYGTSLLFGWLLQLLHYHKCDQTTAETDKWFISFGRLVDKNIEFSEEEITILNLLVLLSFFDNDLDKIDKYILFRCQRTTYYGKYISLHITTYSLICCDNLA